MIKLHGINLVNNIMDSLSNVIIFHALTEFIIPSIFMHAVPTEEGVLKAWELSDCKNKIVTFTVFTVHTYVLYNAIP